MDGLACELGLVLLLLGPAVAAGPHQAARLPGRLAAELAVQRDGQVEHRLDGAQQLLGLGPDHPGDVHHGAAAACCLDTAAASAR